MIADGFRANLALERIAAEITAGTNADTAIDTRVGSLEHRAFIEPDYWVRDDSARTFVVHIEAPPTGANRIRLNVQGQVVTVNLVSGETDYSFNVTQTHAQNVLRNLGTRTTILVNVEYINSSGTQLLERGVLLRVVTEAPSDFEPTKQNLYATIKAIFHLSLIHI